MQIFKWPPGKVVWIFMPAITLYKCHHAETLLIVLSLKTTLPIWYKVISETYFSCMYLSDLKSDRNFNLKVLNQTQKSFPLSSTPFPIICISANRLSNKPGHTNWNQSLLETELCPYPIHMLKPYLHCDSYLGRLGIAPWGEETSALLLSPPPCGDTVRGWTVDKVGREPLPETDHTRPSELWESKFLLSHSTQGMFLRATQTD